MQPKNGTMSSQIGFVLIEALIALLLISVGLLGISKLQVLSLSGSGDSKSRSEAIIFSQNKIEELRNKLVKGEFTGDPMISGTTTKVGANASYAMAWTVSTPTGGLEQRLIQLQTTWTNSKNIQMRIDLNSVVAWDDPGLQAKLTAGLGGSLISPTGSAKRGSGPAITTTNFVENSDHTKIGVLNGITYLTTNSGIPILYLPPVNDVQQNFTRITGKIFFDQGAGNGVPNTADVRVRLSSEGECVDDKSEFPFNHTSVDPDGKSYKYFIYTCYVGPGWYGNVGVLVDDSVNGSAANPTICVGDPSFNGGASDGTLIGLFPQESATRSYRGFKSAGNSYLVTGMGNQSLDQSGQIRNGTRYGLDSSLVGPFDGRPRPSDYSSTVTAGSTDDYLEQNFLVTSISGNGSCTSKMGSTVFARNAGKYICINPDNDAGADSCPSIWPGFESQVGSGVNSYALTVTTTGAAGGTVTSDMGGISCGTACTSTYVSGTLVTLTAAASSGYTFAGWSGGGCTGSSNTCAVNVTAATTVAASFTSNKILSVTTAGTGLGTVSSSPTGISNCSTTCSAGFVSGSNVTLTAAAGSNSVFSGWSGGGCTGTGTCTVTMSSAQAVTATFDSNGSAFGLTVTQAGTGSGTVTSSPAGISCGTTCAFSFASGNNVTLTAVAGSNSTFGGWSGVCSGTNTCVVSMTDARAVTATFNSTVNSLTVTMAGSGAGTVTSTPSGINCSAGTTCTASFTSGTSVTLNASTNNSTFIGWGGSCSGTGACVVSMGSAKSVTATFSSSCNQPISGSAHYKNGSISASSGGTCTMQTGNSLNYNCTLSLPYGTNVTLTNLGNGNTSPYTKQVTVSCVAQSGVNFP